MDPEGFELAGRRVQSIRLLGENGSMGRVVCELLSTQICGPPGMPVQYDSLKRILNTLVREN